MLSIDVNKSREAQRGLQHVVITTAIISSEHGKR